jgi:hypothetical protein
MGRFKFKSKFKFKYTLARWVGAPEDGVAAGIYGRGQTSQAR